MRLILGSNSQRRRAILESFQLNLIQQSSNFNECGYNKNQSPESYVMALAKKKCDQFHDLSNESTVLTADTIVYFNSKILEKPQNIKHNKQMLKDLSGNTHSVYTALSLKNNNKTYTNFEKTLVTFHELSNHNIEQYIQTYSPNDKAGGYSIQDGCGILVKNINGCYFNVLGMPITLFKVLLNNINLDLWDYLKKS